MKILLKGKEPWFAGAGIDCDRCEQKIELEPTDAINEHLKFEKNTVIWRCQNCGMENREEIPIGKDDKPLPPKPKK